MDEQERASKDIEKLENLIKKCRELNIEKENPKLFKHCINYLEDGKHYYNQKDYFSSLGCINYSYGILEALFFLKEKKYFHQLEI